MDKMQDIVWGVIGGGKVCEKKSMPAMQIIPHSRVKTVMRRDETAGRDFTLRHGVPNYKKDPADIFHDPEINAVYIATPPDSHADYAIAAATAGKAVYVEKPMARNYDECRAMIRACKLSGVPLFVAYYRRALPHFLRVRELLENNAIGNVCTVQITFHRPSYKEDIADKAKNWRIQPQISGGGHFHDLASHQLDLMDFLFGPIKKVYGIAENLAGFYQPADTVAAVFSFKNGVTGCGNWCFVSPAEEQKDEILILGTKGSLRFSTFEHACIHGITDSMGVIKEEYELPVHIQEPLIRTIISELRGEGYCPSRGETAVRTSRVMDRICGRTIKQDFKQ
jgi:predicted dehydrogenase